MSKWTDSENLRAREAPVVGGPLDGMRIAVAVKSGVFRYPDVIDLSAYRFDEGAWTFVFNTKDEG